ncbi:MAG: hypothetical protein M1488_05015 [Gammaproteobacteria bacterium]|nr:hypothetical protein [Gammaproteobacteria bacterium]
MGYHAIAQAIHVEVIDIVAAQQGFQVAADVGHGEAEGRRQLAVDVDLRDLVVVFEIFANEGKEALCQRRRAGGRDKIAYFIKKLIYR